MKSINPEIAELNEKKEAFAAEARACLSMAKAVDDQRKAVVLRLLRAAKIDATEDIILSHYNCGGGSPTGQCVYDGKKDPFLVSCYYCCKPIDR